MIRSLFVLLCCAFLSVVHAQQPPVSIKDQLKTVTVYPSSARMEYGGTLSLPAGVSKMTFTNVPERVEWSSIQLSFADRTITVENLSVNRNYAKPKDPKPALARLSARQDSLQRIMDWTRQQQKVLEGEEALLKANQQVHSHQAGVTTSALSQLLRFYREEATRIQRERLENDAVLKQLQGELTSLQHQAAQLQVVNNKSVVEITVDLRTPKAVRSDYNLSLMVGDASWKAAYNIQATALDAPLKVSFRAVIKQHTGEDWNDVNLVLSTAQPALNHRQPTPETRYARIVTSQIDTIVSFNPEAYEESITIVGIDAEEETWVDEVRNLTHSTFALTSKQSIPSDKAERTFTIRDMLIPAKIQHYAAPRYSPHVYLLAEIVNSSEYDLQSGVAQIFNESSYVGKTDINIKSLSDTLQISLGIDQGVYVKRERRDFKAAQWLGAYRQETFDFSLGIRNSKPVPIDVKLLDQIPVSTDKQIEINLLKKDNATHIEGRGELVWQLRCLPGKTETRSFSYRVKYPKDAIVHGKW